MPNRSRSWCATLNNPTRVEVDKVHDSYFNEEIHKYFVFGCEHMGPQPRDVETWTPHLQIYIQFKQPKSARQVKQDFPRAHLEVAKGSPYQAAEYCKKENFVEFGTPPTNKGDKGDNKLRYLTAIALAKQGKFDDIEPDLLVRHYHTWKKINSDYMKMPKRLCPGETDFRLFYGESDSGKSRSIHEEFEDHEIFPKKLTKWWDGYKGQPCVMIEELHPTGVLQLADDFKTWCDLYPFTAESKGSSAFIRPKTIIMTSNFTPEELFHENTHLETIYKPMKRRVKCTQFSKCHIDANIQAAKRRRIERSEPTSESAPTNAEPPTSNDQT